MTAQLEYEGKSLDRAIEKACDALSITREDLDYDVISRGSSGIFGLAGVKKAKIRVNLPEGRTQASSLLDRFDEELSGPEATATSRPEPGPDRGWGKAGPGVQRGLCPGRRERLRVGRSPPSDTHPEKTQAEQQCRRGLGNDDGRIADPADLE